MEIKIQSLDSARKSIDRYLARHRKAKLKTIYKFIRPRADITLVGDWPLISEIVYRAYFVNLLYSPKEVVEVYKLTTDPYLQSRRVDSELVVFLTNRDELERVLAVSK